MVRFIVAALLTAAALAGCQSTDRQQAQQSISDASISAAVQAKLTGNREFNFTRVDVDTERGVVHLRGEVPSAQQRTRASELARQVKGVMRVDNDLRIHDQPAKTGKLSE